jgi:inhibitor of KinA sporulation pathway (predicted exonuclease)
MKPILDKIVVVDIETTCWSKGQIPKLEDGRDTKSEIIEIGICLLDINTKEISMSRGYIVKPENTTISPFCQNLTTLKQENVDKGQSLISAVLNIMDIYMSPRRVWASYGFFEKDHISRECYEKNINNRKFPFSQRHINVKTLFAVKHKLTTEIGLIRALEMINMEPIGTLRRGIDDAVNVARILTTLV